MPIGNITGVAKSRGSYSEGNPQLGYKVLRTFIGKVVSDKMNKSINVEVSQFYKHTMYNKWIRTTSKFMTHDEHEECDMGDVVEIRETRPLSKRKHFTLHRIISKRTSIDKGHSLWLGLRDQASIDVRHHRETGSLPSLAESVKRFIPIPLIQEPPRPGIPTRRNKRLGVKLEKKQRDRLARRQAEADTRFAMRDEDATNFINAIDSIKIPTRLSNKARTQLYLTPESEPIIELIAKEEAEKQAEREARRLRRKLVKEAEEATAASSSSPSSSSSSTPSSSGSVPSNSSQYHSFAFLPKSHPRPYTSPSSSLFFTRSSSSSTLSSASATLSTSILCPPSSYSSSLPATTV